MNPSQPSAFSWHLPRISPERPAGLTAGYRTWRPWLAAGVAAVALSALTACGGGGGGSSGSTDGSGGGTVPVTPAAALAITGTAATGGPIASGTVEAKCNAGTATGTTQANGTYSISVSGGAWPCLLRVTAPNGGVVLHSVATSTGAAATANITPATELILAQLLGTAPASYYTSVVNTPAATFAATVIANAQAQVLALLKAAGVSFDGLGDLITASLAAQTSSTAGDAYDQALVRLAASLSSSGGTLATLTSAVVAASPANATPVTTSLPAESLLQPGATTCAALRSGTYRIVSPTPGTSMAAQSGLAVVDAVKLTIKRPDGVTGTLTANGNCRFTDTSAGYSADVVVSQAGVLSARYTASSGGNYRSYIGFIEQSHGLAELTGDWNYLGMTPATTGFAAESGQVTYDAGGRITAGFGCQNETTWAVDACNAVPASVLALVPALQVSTDGGFVLIDAAAQPIAQRLYLYKAGSNVMLASVSRDGTFAVLAPNKNLALPAVGALTASWNLDLTGALVSAISTYARSNTIQSVDTTAGSYVRIQRTPGTNNDHPETVFIDKPRPGFLLRPAGTSTGADGSAQTINEFTSLRPPGMGFGVGVLPGPKLFEFYVIQP